MHPTRTIRRFHAPIICILVACLFSVGCRRGAWSEERYTFDAPEEAYFTDDGSLLLSVYVSRKFRKSEDGWHWVMIDPERADELINAAMSSQNDDAEEDPPVKNHYLNWRNDNGIKLWPSIRSDGLEHADLPKGHTGLMAWEVRSLGNGQFFELYPRGELDPLEAQFQILPSSYERETMLSQCLKVVLSPLVIPSIVLGVIAIGTLLVYWAIFGGPDWSFGP